MDTRIVINPRAITAKPIHPKYLGAAGIHRVPLWRVGAFALNNTATNLYLIMMGYIAYFMIGFVGVATVFASSFSMAMRIWDGVTDPVIGYLIDKTNTKFGKSRPFMMLGNIVLAVTSFLMFFITPIIPAGIPRIAFFILINAFYYIGYTFQTVVTKAAQPCLTNDPKQRPLFSVFDGIYNTALFAGSTLFISAYLVPKYGSFYEAGLFRELWFFIAIVSALFTLSAVIAIAPKDRTEFFGTGEPVKVNFRDYWDIIKNNRAIQMLVLAASTDKLGAIARTSTVMIVLYGIVVGNYALLGDFSIYTSVGTVVFLIIGIGGIATRLGQRKAMIIGSVGALAANALLVLLWLFGEPRTFNLPGFDGYAGITFFTVALIALSVTAGGFQSIAGNIVIPMTADCADYETYRSGRYVPGLMGTLFSFVDKLISSFAPLIAGVVYAGIGFAQALPDVTTQYNDTLLYASLFLAYGMISVGLIMNLVGMRFYPLTKEKMEEIQVEIAAIKERVMLEREADEALVEQEIGAP